jgi:hypothetical protein
METEMGIRQFEVIDGATGDARGGELVELVAEVTEGCAQWDRKRTFVIDLETFEQRSDQFPWIAELAFEAALRVVGLTVGSVALKAEEWPCGDE